jgi:hypothetical protein
MQPIFTSHKYSFFSALAILALFVGSVFFASKTSAVTGAPPIKDENYQGQFISQSIADPIILKTGESKEVEVVFKNIGRNIWKSTGTNFVSVYTTIASYHDSAFFESKNWVSPHQPTKLGKETRLQEKAVFKIILHAPNKTGEYTEHFQLAAENKTWIKGTGFFLKIKVVAGNDGKNTDIHQTTSTIGKNANSKSINFFATADAPSPMFLQSVGSDSARVTLDFKNSGTSTWEKYQLNEFKSRQTRGDASSNSNITFFDSSWASSGVVVQGDSIVEPNEHLRIEFTLRNPPKRGEYVASFELKINGESISGGVVELPTIVTADGLRTDLTSVMAPVRALITEPQIRVGMYKTSDPVKFISSFNYNVYSGSELKGVLSAGSGATLRYLNGKYYFTGGELDFSSSDYVRLVPDDLSNSFTITNYERRLSGRKTNFNSYRGVLEYHYSPKSALPYRTTNPCWPV